MSGASFAGGAAATAKLIEVVAPNGGETFRVGETMTIRYSANAYAAPAVKLMISSDDGITWQLITDRTFNPVDPEWEAYPWVIPPSISNGSGATIPLQSNTVKIRVEHYNNKDIFDESDAAFSILPASSVRRGCGVRSFAGGPVKAHAVAFDLSGAMHVSIVLNIQEADGLMKKSPLLYAPGLHALKMTVDGRVQTLRAGYMWESLRKIAR